MCPCPVLLAFYTFSESTWALVERTQVLVERQGALAERLGALASWYLYFCEGSLL